MTVAHKKRKSQSRDTTDELDQDIQNFIVQKFIAHASKVSGDLSKLAARRHVSSPGTQAPCPHDRHHDSPFCVNDTYGIVFFWLLSFVSIIDQTRTRKSSPPTEMGEGGSVEGKRAPR